MKTETGRTSRSKFSKFNK